MKYIKTFESIREEYADMFGSLSAKGSPQAVPGFEGAIDPNDDEIWGNNKKSEKKMYQDFLKITKERNFEETEDEIVINMKRLWHDFYMTIYNAKDPYMDFVKKELLGKYLSKGYRDLLTGKLYEGIINRIVFNFDGDSCYVEFQLNGQEWIKDGFCEEFITIDILESDASKYNV